MSNDATNGAEGVERRGQEAYSGGAVELSHTTEDETRGVLNKARGFYNWMRASRETLARPNIIQKLVLLAVGTGFFLYTVGPGAILNTNHPIEGDQVSQNWWLWKFSQKFYGLFTGGNLFGWTDDFGAGQPFGYFYFPLPAIIYSLLQLIVGGAVAAKLIQLGSILLVVFGVYKSGKVLNSGRTSIFLATLAVIIGIHHPQRYPVGGDVLSTLLGEYSYGWGLGIGLLACAYTIAAHRAEKSQQKYMYIVAGCLWAGSVLGHLNAAFVLLPGMTLYILFSEVLGKLQKKSKFLENTKQSFTGILVSCGIASFWLLPMWSMREEIQSNNKIADWPVMYWFPDEIWKTILIAGMLGLLLGSLRNSGLAKMALGLNISAFLIYEILTEYHQFELWSGRAMPVVYLTLLIGVGELGAFFVTKGRGFLRVSLAFVMVGLLLSGGIYQQTIINKDIPTWRERARGTWLGVGHEDAKSGSLINNLVAEMNKLEPGRILYTTSKEGYKLHGAKDLNGELIRRGAGTGGASTFFHEGNRDRFVVAYASSGVMTSPFGIEPNGKVIGLDDFSTGVEMVRQLGVRYYIIGETKLHELATKNDRLKLVASVGNVQDGDYQFFEVYEISNHGIVEAAVQEPGVVETLPLWGETTFEGKAKAWLARVGEKPFEGMYLVERTGEEVVWVGREKYEKIEITDVVVADERVSFKVSKPGVPVVVRMGYSEKWKAKGAGEIYHVAPHGMILVPTSTEVVLEYKNPISERLGMLITLVSISYVGMVFKKRRKMLKETKHDTDNFHEFIAKTKPVDFLEK